MSGPVVLPVLYHQRIEAGPDIPRAHDAREGSRIADTDARAFLERTMPGLAYTTTSSHSKVIPRAHDARKADGFVDTDARDISLAHDARGHRAGGHPPQFFDLHPSLQGITLACEDQWYRRHVAYMISQHYLACEGQ